MKGRVEAWVARGLAALSYVAVMISVWDAWWQREMLTDRLVEPPHLALFAVASIGFLLSLFGWRKARHDERWLMSTISWFAFALIAPVDRFFQHIFEFGKPYDLLTIWHPLHLALAFSMLATAISALSLLRDERSAVPKRMVGSLAFAAILGLVVGLLSPFSPTGVYELIGFWGAGILAAAFIMLLMRAEHWAGHGFAVATPILVLFLVITAVGSYQPSAMTTAVPSLDVVPLWMVVFVVLIVGLIFDASRPLPGWLRGLLSILGGGSLFYLTTSPFLPRDFQFSLLDGAIAVFSAGFGGALAGYLEGFLGRR